MENIKTNILRYIWQLSRLENLFISNNINFSSRNSTNFDSKLVCQLYNNMYAEDLTEVQNKTTYNLHKSLEKVLTKIEV